MAIGKAVPFNNRNLGTRARDRTNISNISTIYFKWVVAKEFFKLGRVLWRSVARRHMIDPDTRLIPQRRIARLLLDERRDGAVGEDTESFVSSTRVMFAVIALIDDFRCNFRTIVRFERLDRALFF